jgi:hypothetical protein
VRAPETKLESAGCGGEGRQAAVRGDLHVVAAAAFLLHTFQAAPRLACVRALHPAKKTMSVVHPPSPRKKKTKKPTLIVPIAPENESDFRR